MRGGANGTMPAQANTAQVNQAQANTAENKEEGGFVKTTIDSLKAFITPAPEAAATPEVAVAPVPVPVQVTTNTETPVNMTLQEDNNKLKMEVTELMKKNNSLTIENKKVYEYIARALEKMVSEEKAMDDDEEEASEADDEEEASEADEEEEDQMEPPNADERE